MPRHRTTDLVALVALLALLAWWPALRAGWIWDDDSYVTENALVQRADGLAGIWGLARDAQGRLVSNTPQYYPLVFTTFWAEHALWGLAPPGYHLTNVLLHVANAWLAWRLLRRLGVPGAGFAAALFALHPMHVESVAWVTERKNVLSGLFYLLAFHAYLCCDERRSARWWWIALACFLGALLSKSVTATLPVALGAALFWRHRRLAARDLALLAPFVVLGAASGWFTAHLEQVKVGATGAEFSQTAAERWLLVAPRAWWHYAAKTLVPHPVQFVYPRWDPHFGDPWSWAAALGVVALVALLFALRPRLGWGPILLVFASAVTLAPALGFVPVYPHRFSWVADHFAYLGSLPLLALLAAALCGLGARLVSAPRRAAVGACLAALALCAFGGLTHAAARAYRDQRTLWERALAANPAAWIAQINLGIELMKDPARTPADERRTRALFEAATAHPLGRAQAWSNLGQWHLTRGDPARAAEAFRASLRAEPGRARPLAGLAAAQSALLDAQGATRATLDAVRAALADAGDDPRLRTLEAWVLATSPDAALRDPAQARGIAERLLARGARDSGAWDALAAACAASGDFAAAVRAAESALQATPPAAQGPVRARLELYRAGRAYVTPAR